MSNKKTYIGQASGLEITHEDLITNITGCRIIFDPYTIDYVLQVSEQECEDYTQHADTREEAEALFMIAMYGEAYSDDMYVHYYPNSDDIESIYRVGIKRP